jgi:hypothetical protein
MKEAAVIRPMMRGSCFVALLVIAQLGLAQGVLRGRGEHERQWEAEEALRRKGQSTV